MEAASNGFEHGYMTVGEVRGLLEPVLERSMRLVRRALIIEARVSASTRDRLVIEEYAEPRGLVPEIALVRGELARIDPDVPPPAMHGGDVELEWNTATPVATRSEDGEVEISFTYEITYSKLPPNTNGRASGFGMRAAYVKRMDAEPLQVEVVRREEENDDKS